MSKLTALSRHVPNVFKDLSVKTYAALSKGPLRKHLPIKSLMIETTSVCNLKCVGCYRTIHEYDGKNKFMSIKDFRHFVDTSPAAFTLMLHGLGEPTLNPDIVKIVSYASKSKKFKTITFTTNLLAKDIDMYRTLFAKGLTNLTISVDSLRQNSVNKMRPHTDVKVFKKKLKAIHDEFADRISISMVVGSTNLKYFEELIDDLVDLGIKKVSIQPYDDLGNDTHCLSEKEKKIFFKKFRAAKRPGLKLSMSSWFGKTTSPCTTPSDNPVISVDGYLVPCCRLMDKSILNYGDMRRANFKDVFFSDEYAVMQNNINKGIYPSACDGCVGNHVEQMRGKKK